MSLVAAAFVPTPPLLVPEVAGGSVAANEPLRVACRSAVARLLAKSDAAALVVLGAAPQSREYRGGHDFRGFGVQVPERPEAEPLPLALGIGSWLLNGRPARFEGVAADAATEACLERGRSLAIMDDVALLVCGDGSARGSEKAPGHLDDRAAAYDERVAAALAAGDPAALAALDAALGADLMCSGRAPWQVLAGAAAGAFWRGEVLTAEAPYGVFYAVAMWSGP